MEGRRKSMKLTSETILTIAHGHAKPRLLVQISDCPNSQVVNGRTKEYTNLIHQCCIKGGED